MQKWEYKILYSRWDEQEFNRLGFEGWELVSITVNSHDQGADYTAVFKRAKP
jgi:hypothetical protein